MNDSWLRFTLNLTHIIGRGNGVCSIPIHMDQNTSIVHWFNLRSRGKTSWLVARLIMALKLVSVSIINTNKRIIYGIKRCHWCGSKEVHPFCTIVKTHKTPTYSTYSKYCSIIPNPLVFFGQTSLPNLSLEPNSGGFFLIPPILPSSSNFNREIPELNRTIVEVDLFFFTVILWLPEVFPHPEDLRVPWCY